MRWCDCDSRFCMHAVTIVGEKCVRRLGGQGWVGRGGRVGHGTRMYVCQGPYEDEHWLSQADSDWPAIVACSMVSELR